MDDSNYGEGSIMSTEDILLDVVEEAHEFSFSVGSNFAREHASAVAMAASMGLISTRVTGNVYSREWRPTLKGLAYLNEAEVSFDDE